MRPAGLGVERAVRGAGRPRGARSDRDLGRRVNALGLRAELLTSVRKRPYSAGVLLRRLGAEGWPSGQWQQTVNLPTYVYSRFESYPLHHQPQARQEYRTAAGGCSSMVEHQPSKLAMVGSFPSPATRRPPQSSTTPPRPPRDPAGAVDGQREVFADEAALQHRDDRSRRSRQDDADGGDHEGAGGERAGRISRRTTRSTRRRRRRRAGSRSTPRTSSTRPATGTTRMSTARATPTTSRT